MFGKRKLLVTLVAVCCTLAAAAQRQKIDSLENILKQHRTNDTVRVSLLNKIAYLSYSNNSKKAKAYATLSGNLSDKLEYKKGKATSLWLMGLSHLGSDKKISLSYFRQALSISEKINDKAGMANYLIAVGNITRDLGDSKQGDACYQRALSVAREIGDKQIEAKCLVNICRSYTSKGMYPQAIEGLQSTIELAKELNDKPLLSRSYNNLGSIYSLQSNHPVALDYSLMALHVNEEANDKSGMMGNLLNIAGVKQEQKEYDEALKSIKDALKIAEELRDTLRKGICLTNIGNIYMKMDDAKALDYFEQALAISKSSDINQSINILLSIGEIHCKHGNASKATESYSEALGLAQSIGLKRAIAQAWFRLGTVYLKQKNYSQALDYTTKSLSIAQGIGLLELQKNTHGQLASIYAATNDYKNAYLHHQQYKKLNDSIFNESNIKKIAELESAYKYAKEKQAHELEKQKKDIAIKNQRIIILTLVAAFILMAMLAITIYRSYKLKKRTNAILTQQKKEIEELNEEYIALNDMLKQSNDELRATQKQLEKSEEKLRLLIKNSNDIFVVTNEHREPLFISDAITKITGYTPTEKLGSAFGTTHPDDMELVKQHWNRVIANKEVADTVQYRHKHKENGYVWLEAVAQNFLDHHAINAVISNIRNIDEQKKAEEAFKESENLKKKLLKIEIEKINSELEANQKAMTAATLKLVQNSERDSRTITMLENIEKNGNPEIKKSIKSLISDYKLQSYNSNWDEFELLFEKVHHSFHEKLNDQFPELTPNERKLCVFLKLNMTTKQIAQITFQSEEALKKARLRLRKKLEIDRDTNLVAFIQNL